MNAITILYSHSVAQIQTGQRRMLEHEVENLLLEFSAVDAVVLQS